MTTRTDIRIRPFREPDRAFFKAIMARLVPEQSTSPRDPGALASVLDQRASGERPYPEGTEVFIAVNGADQPVGLSAIRQDEDYFSGHPRAYIELLAVTEPAEGKGVGRALMDHADRWARDHHCREVVLDVFAENAGAISFYHRMGYRPDHFRMSKPLVDDAE